MPFEDGIAMSDAQRLAFAADSHGGKEADGKLTRAELNTYRNALKNWSTQLEQFSQFAANNPQMAGFAQQANAAQLQLKQQLDQLDFLRSNFAGIAGKDGTAGSISLQDLYSAAGYDGWIGKSEVTAPTPTPQPTPTPTPQPTPTPSPYKGGPVELVRYDKLIASVKKQSKDDTFTSKELLDAALNEKDPNVKNMLWGLCHLAEVHGKNITAADLQKLVNARGGDNYTALNELSLVPELLGWPNKPLATGDLANYIDVIQIMKAHSPGSEYSAAQLKAAANATSNPLYKNALNKLADVATQIATKSGGAKTTLNTDDLQKLALHSGGDKFFVLNEIGPLVDILKTS